MVQMVNSFFFSTSDFLSHSALHCPLQLVAKQFLSYAHMEEKGTLEVGDRQEWTFLFLAGYGSPFSDFLLISSFLIQGKN